MTESHRAMYSTPSFFSPPAPACGKGTTPRR
jgi:hypothetical protein